MKRDAIVLVFSVLLVLIHHLPCDGAVSSKENIIPKPVSIVLTGDSFNITDKTTIYVQNQSVELEQIGKFLANKLNTSTGYGIEVKSTNEVQSEGGIFLSITKDETLGDEGYELTITKEGIKLTANKPAGIFYGVQTIRQLLPPAVEMPSVQKGDWAIATGTIRDYPVYSYRGSMLDVARHFFAVEDVKHFIDQLAYYKMNVLHMHLSDDQGWRIEIKSWPNLTAHGGKTQVDGGKGGFYTQEQYTEIVKYALDNYITIIPEIDMPGHTNAALASYPELNCSGKAPELYTGKKVGFSTLCINKEITYKFVDDVIRELAAITPGPYIHIGGDESHATKIEDYIPFINRVQDIVNSHGKKVFGWDEIALAKLKPNTIVQYWAKAANAVKGVKQGAKVLMSPSKNAYLDMKYDAKSAYGLNWAGYIEVDTGYKWDPANLVPGIKRENIVGIEAPLWTETVANRKEAEYLIFPRLLGYAEIGWTPSELRNWDEYKPRLVNHGARMKAMNINYYRSPLVKWENEDKK